MRYTVLPESGSVLVIFDIENNGSTPLEIFYS